MGNEPMDPCRDALRDVMARKPTIVGSMGEVLGWRDSVKRAEAALATANPLPALVEALEYYVIPSLEDVVGDFDGDPIRAHTRAEDALSAARQALTTLREGGRS